MAGFFLDFEAVRTEFDGRCSAQVFQATEKLTKDARALKRVKTDNATEREGFPITALREANVLKRLAHENVVTLHEVLTTATVEL